MCTHSCSRLVVLLLLLLECIVVVSSSNSGDNEASLIVVEGEEDALPERIKDENEAGDSLSKTDGRRKRRWRFARKKHREGLKQNINTSSGAEGDKDDGDKIIGVNTKVTKIASFMKRKKNETRSAESKSNPQEQAPAKRLLNGDKDVAGRGRKKKMQDEKDHAVHLDNHPNCSNKLSSARKKRWLRRQQRGHITEADVRTAYRMAVLATLAYWNFHKRIMPSNVSGFRLLDESPNSSSRRRREKTLLRKVARVFRLKFCRARQRIVILRLFIGEKLAGIFQRFGDKKDTFQRECSRKLPSLASCERIVRKKEDQGRRYNFDYWLYNWYEPTAVPGVNYHDTDLLVSTSGNDVLVLAFAGTASVSDHLTNVQTFEPASHSGLFDGGGKEKNGTIQGSLHRGFLNAYSRVERGSVLRLCQNCSSIIDDQESIPDLTRSLYLHYGSCTGKPKKRKKKKKKRKKRKKDSQNTKALDTSKDSNASFDYNESFVSKDSMELNGDRSKAIGCRVRDQKLMTVLRELVNNALLSGRTVHLTGHSLGGGLATLLALDIIINFPQIPVSKLYVWTFGAPQVADDLFLRSAIEAAPRLRMFIEKGRKKKRFRRFVTLSDDCNVDLVTTVTERALPSHKRNLRGRAARTLGGVHGNIIHFADPHYLVTPDQHSSHANITKDRGSSPKTTTTLSAHFAVNYLRGISRESKDYPLSTDLPADVREWLGESPKEDRT